MNRKKRKPRCRRCKVTMKEGQALVNTLVASDDFGNDAGQAGTTMSLTGPPKMVPCWKCPKCGHSITKNEQ